MGNKATVYRSIVNKMWLMRWADLNEEEQNRYAHKQVYDDCNECSYFRYKGGVYSIHEMDTAPASVAPLNEWHLMIRIGGGTVIVVRINESGFGDIEVGTIWWTNEGLGFLLTDTEEDGDEV